MFVARRNAAETKTVKDVCSSPHDGLHIYRGVEMLDVTLMRVKSSVEHQKTLEHTKKCD